MPNLLKNSLLSKLPTLLLISGILLLLLSIALSSLGHIIHFSGYAANGAFQLMNPLSRLADGQVLGIDFQFFHGAGVALIHFPLFALFGEGLFGSEISRWFTSIILFVVSTAFFCFAWYKGQRSSLPLGALALGLITLFSYLFAEVITPSNSLLGVRTTVPIIISAIILLKPSIRKTWTIYKTPITIHLYDILIGLTLALAVIMGTEHGISAILAYLVLTLIETASNQPKLATGRFLRVIKSYFTTLLPVGVFGVISLFTIASIVSLGNPISLLSYALFTVPGDQFWYFGAEPQGYLSLRTLIPQLFHPTLYPLYILAGITAVQLYLAKRYKLLTTSQWLSVGFLILYGAATMSSLLGYFSPSGQIVGFMRALLIANVVIFIALTLKASLLAKRFKPSLVWQTLSVITGILLISTASITLSKLDIKPLLRDTYANIKGDHTSLLSDGWKTWIDAFQPTINEALLKSQTPLWSTYANLYEETNGILHPSSGGYDYIIHALGRDRDVYADDFKKMQPELVTTLRPSYFGFEEWLWGRHADFYTQLVRDYTIVAQNDAHALWKRESHPQSQIGNPRTLNIDTSNRSISLPTTTQAGSQLVEVEVSYKVHSAPGLKKIPRYIIKPHQTISTVGFSLPPAKTSWKFLVVLDGDNAQASLSYFADGLIPGANLTISSASYKPIGIDSAEARYFTEESIFLK